MLLLHLADWSLLLFHCALMAFNMFGMLWKRTRLANLIALLVTGGSWTILGIWYGLGYCPLTDWHWQVKAKLGVTNLPNSYVKWLIDAPTGLDIAPMTADMIVVVVYVTALLLSITLIVKDWRRNHGRGGVPAAGIAREESRGN